MKFTGRFATLAVLATCFCLTAAFAQTTPPAQNQPSQQDPNQPPMTGVSQPPADDTIQADEDVPPPVVAPKPKPSAAIPMTPAKPAVTTPQPGDPDYGMVTAVPSSTTASLTRRPWNPDDELVNVVPSNPNELASGTNIRVRLSEGLSSADTRPGQPFHAMVDRDIYKDGRVIIPAGAEMRGRVVGVSQGHHLGPHATIRLRPEMVVLPDGTAYHLYAQAVQSRAPNTKTDDEGGIQAAPHYKKDALEYGAGTGAGAIAGGEIGGPVGAGVGSLVGAGVVTAHMLMTKPSAADLPQGSMLVFSLTEPMELTPTKN